MNDKDEVYFIYSKQQVEEDKQINLQIGRKFIPGDVSVGNEKKKYSKIIETKDLNKMLALYPDTEIIIKGLYGSIKFTKIDNGYIK